MQEQCETESDRCRDDVQIDNVQIADPATTDPATVL